MHATCAPIACMPRCLRLVGVDVGAVGAVLDVGAGKSPAIRSARGDEREKEQRSTASSLGASACAISLASKQAEPCVAVVAGCLLRRLFRATSHPHSTAAILLRRCCLQAASQRPHTHFAITQPAFRPQPKPPTALFALLVAIAAVKRPTSTCNWDLSCNSATTPFYFQLSAQ